MSPEPPADLAALLARDIRHEGPMTVADFVRRCLHDPRHGYYATRPALGEGGDFITAPLVSQMFGELIGLWAVETWTRLGQPDPFRLIEVGPGDGTLIVDALRAARVSPAFLRAARLELIEPSRPLRELQARRLAETDLEPAWISDIGAVETDAPVLLIANEVLDCMPARQFVRTEEGWAERVVGLGDQGQLVFGLVPPSAGFRKPDYPMEPGQVVEISAEQAAFGAALGELVSKARGAALLIDYGRDRPGPGDTLQALRSHRKVDPLEAPGQADLTMWADFPAVLHAALGAGADVTGCRGQGDFLRALGLETRAEVLARAHPARAATLERQVQRLSAPDQMGSLFKACAVFAPHSLAVPGFET